MKKIIVTISVLLNLALLMGASFPIQNKEDVVKKESSCGYTIVEFGKGINCKGDTILLVKKSGIQMRVEETF